MMVVRTINYFPLAYSHSFFHRFSVAFQEEAFVLTIMIIFAIGKHLRVSSLGSGEHH